MTGAAHPIIFTLFGVAFYQYLKGFTNIFQVTLAAELPLQVDDLIQPSSLPLPVYHLYNGVLPVYRAVQCKRTYSYNHSRYIA